MKMLSRPPAYRHFKPKNLAVVRINGRDIYLGKHGSPESWRRYYDVVAASLSVGSQCASVAESPSTISIKRLCLAYIEFAESDYLTNGKLSAEVDRIRYALRRVIKLFGDLNVDSFGPKSLKLVRDQFVRDGQCRLTVNANVSRLKRMFRWAAENELIPIAIYQSVATATGLKKGRSAARESENVLPVSDADVDAALPFMPPPRCGNGPPAAFDRLSSGRNLPAAPRRSGNYRRGMVLSFGRA